MKTCTKCGVEKDLEEFYAHRKTKDGRNSYCKGCDREIRNVNRKNLKDREPEGVYRKKRNTQLRSLYGLSLEDYESLEEAQGGVCMVCGETEKETYRGKLKPLAVDHCHETGAVRGLLCSRCNVILGKAKDSPDLLRKAADYLRHHHDRLGRDRT